MTLALENTAVYDFFINGIEVEPTPVQPYMTSEYCYDAWEASGFLNDNLARQVVMSLTTEAVRPTPPREFLQTTIGSILTETNVRPTFEVVVPVVTSILDDSTAATYLEVMLGDHVDGWLPFQSDRELLVDWIDRFKQPLLNAKLAAKLIELDASTTRTTVALQIQDYEDRELQIINQIIAERSVQV